MIKTTHIVIATALIGTAALAATTLRPVPPLESSDRESKSYDSKLNASGARLLRIDAPIAGIHFKTAKTGDLTVHAVRSAEKPLNGSARRWMDNSKFSVERVGSELRIKDTLPEGDRNWSNDDKGSKDIQLDIEVTVPESMSVDFEVKYGTVDGGGRFGTFTGKVAAGLVDLRALSCSGAVTLNTAAGEISLGLASSISRDSKLSVAAGQIELDLPKSFNAELYAQVGTGDIEGIPAPSRNEDKIQLGRKVRAKLGSGGPKLDLNVGVGTISVNPGSAKFTNARETSVELSKSSFRFSGEDFDFSTQDIDKEISKAIQEATVESDRALKEAEVEIKRAMEELDRAFADGSIKGVQKGDIESIVRASLNIARDATKEALRASSEAIRSAKRAKTRS